MPFRYELGSLKSREKGLALASVLRTPGRCDRRAPWPLAHLPQEPSSKKDLAHPEAAPRGEGVGRPVIVGPAVARCSEVCQWPAPPEEV